MSESYFNPLGALTSFFSGSSHSRLSSNLASIHQHVSQELEPDFYAEWEKGQPKRHRSDTTKSSSSSLFSHVSHEPITTRMYSALGEDRSKVVEVTPNQAKHVARDALPSNQAIGLPSAPALKNGWSWPALDTVQIHMQSISVPIESNYPDSQQSRHEQIK